MELERVGAAVPVACGAQEVVEGRDVHGAVVILGAVASGQGAQWRAGAAGANPPDGNPGVGRRDISVAWAIQPVGIGGPITKPTT